VTFSKSRPLRCHGHDGLEFFRSPPAPTQDFAALLLCGWAEPVPRRGDWVSTRPVASPTRAHLLGSGDTPGAGRTTRRGTASCRSCRKGQATDASCQRNDPLVAVESKIIARGKDAGSNEAAVSLYETVGQIGLRQFLPSQRLTAARVSIWRSTLTPQLKRE
jgi:hypothetical protein